MPVENPFDALEAHYPAILDEMPAEFDSHAFILKLAERHQGLYIDALAQHRDNPAPFNMVHRLLALRLKKYRDRVTEAGSHSSPDIWGNPGTAMRWRKVR